MSEIFINSVFRKKKTVKKIEKKSKSKSTTGAKNKRGGPFKTQELSTERSSFVTPVSLPTEEEKARAKPLMFPIKISRPNVNPVSSDLSPIV